LVELKIQKDKGLSIHHSKKSIAINSESGVPVIEVTNEYGNSVRYEISDDYKFDSLWSQLWQFVKDSQH
jgi:hypothetical protein